MMWRKWFILRVTLLLSIAAIAVCLSVARCAQAAWPESLVMPGELVAPHARYERQCYKCHDPFDKAGQARLCLDCHKDVNTDLTGKRGYHGRDPLVAGQACRKCHAEHQGRAATLARLDRKTFDHRLTNRGALGGGHAQVACDKCHTPGKRFREAPSQCSGCHGSKDPHEGSVGTACDSCHAEAGWKNVRFNHDNAAFRLEGRHREAQCDGCHKTKRFKPTPNTCAACHDRNDRHHGSFGSNCQSCHTPLRKWSATEFDHTRKTQFALVGRHASTGCEKCHRDGLAAERTSTACLGCHERDEPHHGQFGRACETCHTPGEWRRHTFVHGSRTHFTLRGRHTEIRCTACHHGNAHDEHLSTACNTCHRHDDVHRGRQGARCDKCHDERGWSRGVLFDHDATPFPLLGAHARVACAGCHASTPFKKVAHACVACHEADATRRCQRGAECERCHDTTTFRLARNAR